MLSLSALIDRRTIATTLIGLGLDAIERARVFECTPSQSFIQTDTRCGGPESARLQFATDEAEMDDRVFHPLNVWIEVDKCCNLGRTGDGHPVDAAADFGVRSD